MPFDKKMRDWHVRAQGERCQTAVYSEESGWTPCGSSDDLEVDHLYPESELLWGGEININPNASPAIVRCQPCHSGDGLMRDNDGEIRLANFGESGWSRHPDMGQALQDYRDGDKESFKIAAQKHVDAAKNGERITNDDYGVTEWELQNMKQLESEYMQEHPEDPKPDAKIHVKYKRRHWFDGLFP